MLRGEVLDTAKSYVQVDRQATHGDLEDNFAVVAKLWSGYTGTRFAPVDVAAMMSLLKLARIRSNPAHPDNWIDLAGYAACGGELSAKPPIDCSTCSERNLKCQLMACDAKSAEMDKIDQEICT